MRRLASLVVLAFAMVALVGVPTAAHDRDHDSLRHWRTPSFAVLVSSARQGGTMLIAARVSPPRGHRHRMKEMLAELSATAEQLANVVRRWMTDQPIVDDPTLPGRARVFLMPAEG